MNYKIFFFMFYVMLMQFCFAETFVFENANYKLSFFDDFNKNELDLTKWSRCKEQKRQNLNAWWKDSCVYIDNGRLVIECLKDDDGILCSGGITSKDKFSQNQGLFEIKFKITEGLLYGMHFG